MIGKCEAFTKDGEGEVSVFNLFKISSLGFNWLFTFDFKPLLFVWKTTEDEQVELTDEVEHVEDDDENEFEDW